MSPLARRLADRLVGAPLWVHLAGLVAVPLVTTCLLVPFGRSAAPLAVAAVALVSVAATVGLGRMVSRALGRLADQAQDVAAGRLVEIEVAGPREVRIVSTTLGAAVAGVRRVQDQARAVARGDLAGALREHPLPGPLGEAVHSSVQQIVAAMHRREELQHALAFQAAHDPLTALPNRAQALRLATSALHRAQRSGDLTALLFLDLDGFKAINDGLGHAAGDTVLRVVASRLEATVRSGDVVCRLGGDEFVVLVEQVVGERDLLEQSERLIAAITQPIDAGTGANRRTVSVGASVGVAVSRDGGTDADVLLAQADAAVYRAKARGRGRVELFDEGLRAQIAAHAELEAALGEGLEREEMTLHYQPVMDLASRQLIGYEALLRWERPGHGTLHPVDFLDVAEGTHLVCDLGRWALREATSQLAWWRQTRTLAPGAPEPTVAVNVSGRHLADPHVVADVTEALAAAGLPPHLLVLEVSETVLIGNETAVAQLAALREVGVRTAIDDFGTGYTSLGQLGAMPVDSLKIAGSFVTSTDPGHRALVALMIQAAHTFGLSVIAEGVEDLAQLTTLTADRCDQVQGFLLGPPAPAAVAAAWLHPERPVAP